jgi:hypothetical protein
MPLEMTNEPQTHVAATPHDQGGAADHGHGHESEALGPIDVQAWGALVLGIALALIVALSIAATNLRAA